MAILTAQQRELYFFKLQDPVFSTELPGPFSREWTPQEDRPKEDANTTSDNTKASLGPTEDQRR